MANKLEKANTLTPTPPEELDDTKKEQVTVEERGPAKKGAEFYQSIKEKLRNRGSSEDDKKSTKGAPQVQPPTSEEKEIKEFKPPRKKTGIILAIVGVIGILSFVAAYFFNREESPQNIPNVNIPTTQPFRPFRPSVYADDPDILQLEEDMNVLNIELSAVPLPESILIPPTLDFNIRFD